MHAVSADRALLFRLATSSQLERIVTAVPAAQRRAWRAASRYVAGTTFGDAARTARALHEVGVGSSIDQFGELVHDASTAAAVASDYLRLAADIAALPETVWLSVDLTHLGLDIEPQRCAEYLTAIAAALPVGRRIQVGAEDCSRTDAVLACILTTAGHGQRDRLGATVQANLRRSPTDLDRLIDAGVHVRLVKGAYVEAADLSWPFGQATDIAYVQLAHRLADAGSQFALATHDGVLQEALLAGLGPRSVEQLLGVQPARLDALTARGIPTRVYIPFGDSWFRYWMRRVAESRGA